MIPKGRKRIALLTIGALVAAVAGYAVIESWRLARERKDRQAVYYWIRSMDWWDHELTEAENLGRQLDALRGLGTRAVRVMRRDLVYDPARFRIARALPFLGQLPLVHRLFPQPDDFEGPQEVRHRAAYVLGMLGPDARAAVPELLSRTADADARIRFEVAFSLGRIGVDSPEVRSALTNLLGDGDRFVQFSAAISLWMLEPDAAKSVSRVESLISTTWLSWPGICLQKIGPAGRVFVPVVEQAIAPLPWSYGRVQAVHALWSMTGDRPRIVRELELLSRAVGEPSTTNTTTGWTAVEEAVGYAVSKLDDEREFRDALRPALKRILDKPDSQARRMATVYLERFDTLDRRTLGGPGESPSKQATSAEDTGAAEPVRAEAEG